VAGIQPRKPKGTPVGGQFDRNLGGGPATLSLDIPKESDENFYHVSQAWSGFQFRHVDVPFKFAGELGIPYPYEPPITSAKLLTDGRVAPRDDPYRYFKTEPFNRKISEWLLSRGVETLSVNTYKSHKVIGIRTPDVVTPTDGGAIEFKALNSNIHNHYKNILYASTQSSRIIVYHSGNLTTEHAKWSIGNVLEDFGIKLDGIMYYLEKGDSCVFWQR